VQTDLNINPQERQSMARKTGSDFRVSYHPKFQGQLICSVTQHSAKITILFERRFMAATFRNNLLFEFPIWQKQKIADCLNSLYATSLAGIAP